MVGEGTGDKQEMNQLSSVRWWQVLQRNGMLRRRTEVLDGVVHQDTDGQGDSDVKTQRSKGNEP